jgi:hypothetical protein
MALRAGSDAADARSRRRLPVVGDGNRALTTGHRLWEGGRPPKEIAMVSVHWTERYFWAPRRRLRKATRATALVGKVLDEAGGF